MKKRVKLNESALMNIIGKHINEALSGDYTSVDDWNKELSNTDNLYDYDEKLSDARQNLDIQGRIAQNYHPQGTPWASEDPDDFSSVDSMDVLFDEPEEIGRKYSKRNAEMFPSSLDESSRRMRKKRVKLNEGLLRAIIRESLLEAENGGWVVDDSEAMEAYAFAEEKMGKETIDTAIIRAMSTHQLAEILAYIFRVYDFREWDEYKSNKDSEI